MIRSLIFFAAFIAITSSASVDRSEKSSRKAFFVANPSSNDYKLYGKNEEHRYGVELKENNQFHHTTTAEDGVRLGCYGHEQYGKTFLTHYVADKKGYRLVPHDKVIIVYPRGEAESRKASFMSAFDEDEINKNNIRYFFPAGCKAPEIREIPPIQKKSDEPIEIPKFITTTTETIKPTTYRPTTTSSSSTYLPTTTQKAIALNATAIETSESVSVPAAIVPFPNLMMMAPKENDTMMMAMMMKSEPKTPHACSTDACCEMSRPEIILPSKSDSCCQDYSTLVIPIRAEKLAKISIAEIQAFNNADEDLIVMLINLIKLVEKCRN